MQHCERCKREAKVVRYAVSLIVDDEDRYDDGFHVHDERLWLCDDCSMHVADDIKRSVEEVRRL